LTDFLCCVVYAQSLDNTFGSDIEGKSVIAGEARQTLREKYISFYEFASLHSQRHYKSVRIIERVQLSFFLYDGASDFAVICLSLAVRFENRAERPEIFSKR
jgi:hypothetical protein